MEGGRQGERERETNWRTGEQAKRGKEALSSKQKRQKKKEGKFLGMTSAQKNQLGKHKSGVVFLCLWMSE